MKITDKRNVIKRIEIACKNVQKEISGLAADGGMYARGMSTEGFAGGYRAALDDCLAALVHGTPKDDRGWWKND